MNPIEITDKSYPRGTEQRHILLIYGLSVVQRALKIADAHPNLLISRSFVREAAFLHDIGTFLTDAPTTQCFREHPYITHGYLGTDLLQKKGFERHTLVCGRHTGTGLTLEGIIGRQPPVPHREMVPVTLEEQMVCFVGESFSKTHLDEEETIEKTRKNVAKYDEEGLNRFDGWRSLFL